MNPYWGTDFFGFFAVLFQRIGKAVSGGASPFAADELQMAVLALIALSCGLIGPFLVLKRVAMFANSISHTILLGVALAYLAVSSLWGGGMFDVGTLLFGALIAAAVTAFLTEVLMRLFRLQEDASVGLVFNALFALVVTVITLFTRDVHIGVEAVMGNADLLQFGDLKLALALFFLNLAAVVLFFKQFQLASFDRSLAKTLGIPCGAFHFLLLFLAAATCVGAFRAVGVLLVLAFLVGPYLIARFFCCRLPWLIFWSSAVGVLISVIGVALSRHLLSVHGWALSTGGIVVVLLGAAYAAAAMASAWISRRRAEQASKSKGGEGVLDSL